MAMAVDWIKPEDGPVEMLVMDIVSCWSFTGVSLFEPGALFRDRFGQQQSVPVAAAAAAEAGAGRPAALPALRHLEPTGQRHRLRLPERYLRAPHSRCCRRRPINRRRSEGDRLQRHSWLDLRGLVPRLACLFNLPSLNRVSRVSAGRIGPRCQLRDVSDTVYRRPIENFPIAAAVK